MELSTCFWVECSHTSPSAASAGPPGMQVNSYEVCIFVPSSAGQPYSLSVLQDYADLIRGRLDCAHLNDLVGRPTLEAIAEWVFANMTYFIRPSRVVVSRPASGASVEFVPEDEGHAVRARRRRRAFLT